MRSDAGQGRLTPGEDQRVLFPAKAQRSQVIEEKAYDLSPPNFANFASFGICPNGLYSHFFLQPLQGAEDQFAPELLLFFRRQVRVAGGADDAAGGDGAERADFFSHRDHGANLRDGDLEVLDFLADRCTAASARSSGRGENHAGDACGFQSFGDLTTNEGGVLNGGVGAASGMNEIV